MAAPAVVEAPSSDWFQLKTLILLNIVALAAQAVVLITTVFVLGFEARWRMALVLIAIAAIFAVALAVYTAARSTAPGRTIASLLIVEFVEFVAILLLTGGMTNPFAFLLCWPVFAALMMAQPELAKGLGVATILVSLALAFAHLALPWNADDPFELPTIYGLAVWFCVSSALTIALVGNDRLRPANEPER